MARNVPQASVNSAYGGGPAGPVPGNFGFSGPPNPSLDWEPSAGIDALGRAFNYGEAPMAHGSVALKSMDFLQYQYLVPPMHDGIGRKLMPEMLVFSVNERDTEDGSTIIMSVAGINRLMQEQWDDFERAANAAPNNAYQDAEAIEFKGWLETYGERGLEDIAYKRSHPYEYPQNKNNKDEQEMVEFLNRATSPGYCYLTRYGILRRLSFLGVVINTNRAVGLETEDNTDATDHYTQVNVGLGKRVRTANVFGSSDEMTTGAKVWIKLTRKRCRGTKNPFGAFCLIPSGSRVNDRPLARELNYRDDAGMICTGHVFRVGVVIQPGDFDPRPAALEQASGTGYYVSPNVAYEAHGTLPSMYVAIGFKN